MNQKLLFYTILLFFFLACGNESETSTTKPGVLPENLIAETIIYDVIVKNPNPDDKWTNECLQYFDRGSFVDDIFLAVYNGEMKAYGYFDDDRITPRELKKMEENGEIARNRVGKIQFTEKWYYDKNNLVFYKEVLSLVFGEQLIRDDGTVRGYKPIFKVDLGNK